MRSFWLCNFCVGYDRCGEIEKNHLKRGRFVLPVVGCTYSKEKKCWGPLLAENPANVTVNNTHEMSYACKGHFEIHKGGEYVKEDDSDKASR